MRLIDADELKVALVKHFDAYFNENGELMYSDHICTSDDVSDLFNLIDEQMTAYDVDMVLKLIENIEVSKDSGGVVSGCNQGICESDDCLKCLKNKLIEIVKEGGKYE